MDPNSYVTKLGREMFLELSAQLDEKPEEPEVNFDFNEFLSTLKKGKAVIVPKVTNKTSSVAPKKRGRPRSSVASPSTLNCKIVQIAAQTPKEVRSNGLKDQDYVPDVTIAPVQPKQGGRLRKPAQRSSVEDDISSDEEVFTPKRPKVPSSASTGKKKSSKATPKRKSPVLESPREFTYVQKSAFSVYKEKQEEKAIRGSKNRRSTREPTRNMKYAGDENFGIDNKPRVVVDVNCLIDDITVQEQFMFLLELKPKAAVW